MDLADERQRARWRAGLGAMFTDRLVITGLLPLAAFTPWLELLREAGARRPLVVAAGRGVGPVPTEGDADVVMFDVGRFPSMTEELRAQDHLARHLPAKVAEAVDTYDPDGEAAWLLGPFVVNEPIDDRQVFGGRPATWLALEDKLLADDVWRQVGVAHSATHVVPVEAAELEKASSALDRGVGVVWAGDARDGFNGGGDFVRWVVDAEDRAEALRFFAPRCDRVRVMPFLEGVPCSIHGIVLPDGTAAFRPVELAIMRGTGRRFVYGGRGSTWDPPAADRDAMRELVRRTGEHLRGRVGYRGAFGVDGVLTAEGFRPTELNTRLAGGLNLLAQGVDPAAFSLLQFACLAGRDPAVTVPELETWALAAMDADRVVRAIAMSDRRVVEESLDIPVRWDGETLERVGPAGTDRGGAQVTVGPGAVGAFCRLSGDLVEPGQRMAALNVALLRFLDAEVGTSFGPVSPAPDPRRVPPH